MKKTLTFKCLALGVLVAMLLCSCSGVGDYQYVFNYDEPEILGSVNVADPMAEAEVLYAENDNFELYIDEQKATFKIVDKNDPTNVWSSAPLVKKPAVPDYVDGYKSDETMSLIRVNYSNQLGPATSALLSYQNCVVDGNATIYKLQNGARFEFNFARYGLVIPIQVLMHPQGFEISLMNKGIQEKDEAFNVTSVDVAPYFMSTFDANGDGYYMLPDGEGALVDWNKAADSNVKYRGFVYGRDNAMTTYEQKTLTEDIRMPVFGAQWQRDTEELKQAPVYDEFGTLIGAANAGTFEYNRIGYTAIITEGASRAALNADLVMSNNMAYAEFIYRDIARVKVESSTKLQNFVERSNTQIPVQTVRYVLMSEEKIDYVDMANVYRRYLLEEAGVTKKTQAGSAPMVIELFGGMMKQQFVMGFPVDKVVPLTSYEDAEEIVKALKAAGVNEIVVNYTQWYEDATGAEIHDSIQAEGELGGDDDLEDFIELCNRENISLYLDLNTNIICGSSDDATSTVRWDPAIKYYYNPNTGLPDMGAPLFMLKPTMLVDAANDLATSAKEYNITGVSSTVLGKDLYSDFAKRPYTRDHAEYFWNDALKILADSKGKLLLTGGNAYALDEATFIVDAPMDNSDFLCLTESIPFYQIVMHGVVPLSTPAINESEDVRDTFLWAVETGSNLKWNWTAQNQDELVESIFNHMIGSDYEKWIGTASAQYQEAQLLLKKIATYTVAEHEKLTEDVVRVLWTDGANSVEVFVNYGDTAYDANGLNVAADNFAFRVK